MKTRQIVFYLLFFTFNIFGQIQNKIELVGEISFISSQYYYVAFDNTAGIQKGDTLYSKQGKISVPSLVVEHLSGRSCAGKLINGEKLLTDDKITAYVPIIQKTLSEKTIPIKETNEKITDVVTEKRKNEEKIFNTQNFRGKIGITSYSGFDNFSRQKFSQRWRYQISADGNNIFNTGLGLESYILFSYRNKDWGVVKSNLGTAIKIYDLNIRYDLNDNNALWLGRKINNKISNIGTMDGLQYESTFNKYFVGAVIGSRPNLYDFGYNFKMFQFGVYAGRQDTINTGVITNTVSFINQTNNFKTDRRFVYIQHTNNVIENVNLFLSSELDLYRRKNQKEENKIFLTSFYTSINFSPSAWFSVNTSYDARKNVVYYETFKSYADSLLESETRQGVRIRTNFKLNNQLFISFNYGYRFKNGDNKTNTNYGGNLNYNKLPLINGSSSFSYNRILSSYLDGNTYSLYIYKDLVSGLISTGFGYRRVEYKFLNNNAKLAQNIASMDLSLFLMKKLYLSCNYEGVFEKQRTYSSIYLNLSQKF
ncbi:MAG: hypothetical protein V1773_16660 [bacterium]